MGMTINVDLSICNLESTDCYLIAYFYYVTGAPLRDLNGEYRTYDDSVSVGVPLVPSRREQTFRAIELFLPYDELHLESGIYDLSFFIRIAREATNQTLAKTGHYFWHFTNQ